MHKRASVAGMVGLAACLLSCRTVTLTPRPPIPVPTGLSQVDVEAAVLASLSGDKGKKTLSAAEEITDNALKAGMWRYESVRQGPSGTWFVESVSPGAVESGYVLRDHYLRAAIEFDDTTVNIRVVDSRNLQQDGDSIHKNAVRWLDQLEVQLRRSLGQKSLEQRRGTGLD